MSADEQVAKEEVFQKPGDLVERNEETGVMQVESLCMNCHENVGSPKYKIKNTL
jgi:zinc finger protein